MIEKDKKDFRLMMGEVLEQIVLPQIQEMRDDVKSVKKDIKEFKTENMKEHEDLQDSITQIGLQNHAVLKRQDEQGNKIIKINKVLKLEPRA